MSRLKKIMSSIVLVCSIMTGVGAFAFTCIQTNDYVYTIPYTGHVWECKGEAFIDNTSKMRMEDICFSYEAAIERYSAIYAIGDVRARPLDGKYNRRDINKIGIYNGVSSLSGTSHSKRLIRYPSSDVIFDYFGYGIYNGYISYFLTSVGSTYIDPRESMSISLDKYSYSTNATDDVFDELTDGIRLKDVLNEDAIYTILGKKVPTLEFRNLIASLLGTTKTATGTIGNSTLFPPNNGQKFKVNTSFYPEEKTVDNTRVDLTHGFKIVWSIKSTGDEVSSYYDEYDYISTDTVLYSVDIDYYTTEYYDHSDIDYYDEDGNLTHSTLSVLGKQELKTATYQKEKLDTSPTLCMEVGKGECYYQNGFDGETRFSGGIDSLIRFKAVYTEYENTESKGDGDDANNYVTKNVTNFTKNVSFLVPFTLNFAYDRTFTNKVNNSDGSVTTQYYKQVYFSLPEINLEAISEKAHELMGVDKIDVGDTNYPKAPEYVPQGYTLYPNQPTPLYPDFTPRSTKSQSITIKLDYPHIILINGILFRTQAPDPTEDSGGGGGDSGGDGEGGESSGGGESGNGGVQ